MPIESPDIPPKMQKVLGPFERWRSAHGPLADTAAPVDCSGRDGRGALGLSHRERFAFRL
jgi:hypothetical protein